MIKFCFSEPSVTEDELKLMLRVAETVRLGSPLRGGDLSPMTSAQKQAESINDVEHE